MMTTEKTLKEKKEIGLDPTTSPDMCSRCGMPIKQCVCLKKTPPPSQGRSDVSNQSGEETSNAPNPERITEANLAGSDATDSPQKASTSTKKLPIIELLLKRAKNMGLDPQKLLKNEGINIEQKANVEELQRLAQNGNKMAKELYIVAAENIQNRSKLASKHLDSIKNPFQTKNTKD